MRFGLIGFLVVALLVGAFGVVTYNAGISTGAAEAAIADGATVVYPGAGWSPFGGIFGFFFLFLVFGFLFKALAWRRWSYGPSGWGGKHGYGPTRWRDENGSESSRPSGQDRQGYTGNEAAGATSQPAGWTKEGQAWTQPQPQVQPAPQVQPQPQVQSAPQVQPQPQVQSAPQVQPQPQVQPAPQVQPQPQVQPAPQVQPQPQVQPYPGATQYPATVPSQQVDASSPPDAGQYPTAVPSQVSDSPQTTASGQYPVTGRAQAVESAVAPGQPSVSSQPGAFGQEPTWPAKTNQG